MCSISLASGHAAFDPMLPVFTCCRHAVAHQPIDCAVKEFQKRVQKLVDRYEAQFLKKKDRKVSMPTV